MRTENDYIYVSNADGKVWILPTQNLKTGFNIYQPSSRKGILLKRYLPLVMKIPIVRSAAMKRLGIHYGELNVPQSVMNAIKNTFGGDDLTLSYFAGTPSIHQKETVQVSRYDQILGYVKFTKSKEIQKVFASEQEYLDWLDSKAVGNIPHCLYCGRVDDELYVFIQDTIKTNQAIMEHELGKWHIAFLDELKSKTEVVCAFGESDYRQTLDLLKAQLHVLKSYGIACKSFDRGLRIVETSLEGVNHFSAYHGDFTPWNSFVENGRLYAFDFEYAKKTYPAYMDVFHYYTQSSIFEQKRTADEIYHGFRGLVSEGILKGLFKEPEIAYLQYLYAVISFYVQRDGENLKGDNRRNMQIWLGLIDLLAGNMHT